MFILMYLVFALLVAAVVFVIRDGWKSFQRNAWPKVKAFSRILRAGSPVKLGLNVLKAAFQGVGPQVAAAEWGDKTLQTAKDYIDDGIAADEAGVFWTPDLKHAIYCLVAAVFVFLLAVGVALAG